METLETITHNNWYERSETQIPVESLHFLFHTFNHFKLNVDSFSKNQLFMKGLVCNRISKYIENDMHLCVCGSWYGILPFFLQNIHQIQVTSVDIDPDCEAPSKYLNSQFSSYKHITGDMCNLDYSDYDVVINTSFEHLVDYQDWLDKLPGNIPVLIQSNNMTQIDGHINCSDTFEDFKNKVNFNIIEEEILYRLPPPMDQYERYITIGSF